MAALRSPAPVPERRGALRYPVVVPALLSTAPGEAVGITITDISEGGCQVARGLELERDANIILSFGGYAPVAADVIWTSPIAFGLRFDAPLHAALVAQVVSAGQGRRRARKLTSGLVRREEREKLWHLALPAHLTVAGETCGNVQPIEGELSDLSLDGCRINVAVAILPGSPVSVAIAGNEAVAGSVRWCQNGGIGIGFDEPLEPFVVERIARRNRRCGSAALA